jgi:hypothetical protein
MDGGQPRRESRAEGPSCRKWDTRIQADVVDRGDFICSGVSLVETYFFQPYVSRDPKIANFVRVRMATSESRETEKLF